jgi:large subunit ribosomal protein L17
VRSRPGKAKELKRIADKIITQGKKGTAHARRLVSRDVRDPEVVEKLFGPLAERFAKRAGGYSRIIHVGRRHGDNASVSIIELVDRVVEGEKKGDDETKGEKAPKAAKKKADTKSDTKAPAEKAPKAKAKKAKGE